MDKEYSFSKKNNFHSPHGLIYSRFKIKPINVLTKQILDFANENLISYRKMHEQYHIKNKLIEVNEIKKFFSYYSKKNSQKKIKIKKIINGLFVIE